MMPSLMAFSELTPFSEVERHYAPLMLTAKHDIDAGFGELP